MCANHLVMRVKRNGEERRFPITARIRQSYTTGELRNGRIALNGDLIELGKGDDVLFDSAEREILEFDLKLMMFWLTSNEPSLPLHQYKCVVQGNQLLDVGILPATP